MKKFFFNRLIKGLLGFILVSALVLGGLIITGNYSHTQLVQAVSDVPNNVENVIKQLSGGIPQVHVAESPSFELGYDKILAAEVPAQPLQVEIPTVTTEETQVIEVAEVPETVSVEEVKEVEQVDTVPEEEVHQENHAEDATVETVTGVVTASTELTSVQEQVQVESQPEQVVTVSTGTAVDDATAKEWIAQKESGGSYTATNGIYIGRYQLSNAYLNGDHSPENQDRVADEYVLQRYGSWSAAYQFWLANGWY